MTYGVGKKNTPRAAKTKNENKIEDVILRARETGSGAASDSCASWSNKLNMNPVLFKD